jgi:serralysin
MATYTYIGGPLDDPNSYTVNGMTPMNAPGASDTIDFASGGSPNGNADVGFVTVEGAVTLTGDLQTAGGVFASAPITINAGGDLDSSDAIFTSGAMTVQNGGQLEADGATFDGPSFTVDGSGSSYTDDENFLAEGPTTVTFSNGAQVQTGGDPGDTDVIDGGSFTVTTGAMLTASAIGTADGVTWTFAQNSTLTLSGGGNLAEGGAVGADLNGTGDIDDATINSQGGWAIGGSGLGIGSTGVATFQDGANVTVASLYLGDFDSDEGTLTVSGAATVLMIEGDTSIASSAGLLLVGNDGDGNLTINQGSTVIDTITSTLADSTVGFGSDSTGTVTVDGSATSWQTFGTLDVGGDGFGQVTVQNKGSMTATQLDIAEQSDSGTQDAPDLVDITGDGSSLTVADELDVGVNGVGALLIEAGGAVTISSSGTMALVVGDTAMAVGTVTVTDPGSVLTTEGTAIVGNSGLGTLEIENQGSAMLGGLIVAAQPTSGSAATPDSVTSTGAGSSLIVTGDATVDGAMPTPTNDEGEPDGTCGEWTYTDSGIGTILASNGGYISIGQTLTLLAPPDNTLPPIVTIQSGGGMEVGGNGGLQADTLQIDDGGLIVGHGTIQVGNGAPGAFTNGTIANDGTIEAMDGTLLLQGDVTGDGIAQIDQNSTLEVSGAFSGTVMFNGTYQTTLKIDQPDPTDFTGTIGGLQAGDVVDMPLSALPGEVAHSQIDGSDLELTFSNGTVWQYQLDGDYSDDSFDLLEDNPAGGANGTETDLEMVLQPNNPKIDTGIDGAPTANPYINSLLWGWGAWNPGAGPITYWFGDQGDVMDDVMVHGQTQYLDCDSTVDTWTGPEEQDFINALNDYSSVCGLTFAPASSAETADIVWWLDPTIAAAQALGVSEVPAESSGGQLWQYFDDTPWNADPDQLSFGGDGNNTIVHELGHTLGMAHPHDGGNEPDATTFPGVPSGEDQNTGLNGQNQAVYTIMSYKEGWDGENPNPPPLDYGTQGALGAFDIATLQELYGANDAATNDNQTFTLPTANAAGSGWSSIWAPGGINTITAGGTDLDCTIDLRPAPLTGPNAGGYESYATGILGGYTIANGSDVDNAIGGTGDDTFFVNADDDTITGGGGSDTVVFPDNLADYTLHRVGTVVTVTMDGITDTLNQITTLQFADQSIPANSVLCFASGTHILTDRGEIAVERLHECDRVRTSLSDGTAPIIWIGRRRVNCARHPDPRKVWPVRVSAGAFEDDVPHRDLWLSPDHAVHVDGVLIPIKYLINGTSIAQVAVDKIVYYHVELQRHDVLLAEGLPAESYLDTGDRRSFDNAGEVIRLHPDFVTPRMTGAARWEAAGCAPLVVSGKALEAVRGRLRVRAMSRTIDASRQPQANGGRRSLSNR